ncbi:MAG: hypothetical protein VXW08_05835, partial [Candidatus Thermoplasmatota archaeon]|nr:hypothetical protein [Candidatus Thermoplasmatota archaeon]
RIVMDTGQEIDVDEKFSILRTPSAETKLIQVEGLSVNALLSQEDGSPVTGSVILTDTELQGDTAAEPCSAKLTSPCSIPIGEGGTISIGPIPARSHTISYDSDLDGFYDLVASVLPENAASGSVDLDLSIPLTADLEISLLSESGSIVPDLDLTIRSASGLGFSDMRYDSETATYKAELIPGEYHLNYTLGETQVWELITLDEDLSMSAQFRKSSVLSGTVFTSDDDNAPEPDDYVQFAEVVARWSGFEISTVADEEGKFEFTLPLGENVTVTSTVGLGNLVDGLVVLTSEENAPIELVTRKGIVYEGYVSVNRGNYLYDNSIVGWEPLTVLATNTTSDVTWTSEVNEVGDFEIALPTGEWSISLLDSTFTHAATTT